MFLVPIDFSTPVTTTTTTTTSTPVTATTESPLTKIANTFFSILNEIIESVITFDYINFAQTLVSKVISFN